MEKQIQIMESSQDGPDNNLYKKILNFLTLKNDENQSVKKVIEGKENLENILKTSSEKDSGCIINRIYEDNIDGLIEYLKAMEIKLEIIKYLSESNLITPMEYAEIIKELNSIIATSILGYLEKKLGKERYIQILIKIGHIKAEPEEAIKDTKEPKKSSENENNTGNTSNLGLILSTLYKLVSEAKTLFVDEKNRLKYIGYILIFSITALAIGGGLYVVNKNPKLFSSDVIATSSINGSGNTTAIVGNNITVKGDVYSGNSFINVFINTAHADNADSEELDKITNPTEQDKNKAININISANKCLEDVDNIKELKPDEKTKIKEICNNTKVNTLKVISRYGMRNNPTVKIHETTFLDKLSNEKYRFTTIYTNSDDISMYKSFSTYFDYNYGTYIDFDGKIKKKFLVTCSNLIDSAIPKNTALIIAGNNCESSHVKFIQPLLVQKPISNYINDTNGLGLNQADIDALGKLFLLNKGKNRINNCIENNCLYYQPNDSINPSNGYKWCIKSDLTQGTYYGGKCN